jgi:hypothetical protein
MVLESALLLVWLIGVCGSGVHGGFGAAACGLMIVSLVVIRSFVEAGQWGVCWVSC